MNPETEAAAARASLARMNVALRMTEGLAPTNWKRALISLCRARLLKDDEALIILRQLGM